MKLLLIALLLLADTTAVVDASKTAKEKRKKSTTKVITNSDVKKSKGKLQETNVGPAPSADAAAGGGATQSTTEKHEADKKARKENEAAIAALDKQIADLEQELARVEQSYYEENDPDRRDTEIVRRFADVKKQLDAARVARDSVSPPGGGQSKTGATP